MALADYEDRVIRSPKTVSDLRVGDKAVRLFPGWSEEAGGGPDWRNEAEVTGVTDDVVTALVGVDMWRTMRFDRTTGYSVDGPEYGRLVPAEEDAR